MTRDELRQIPVMQRALNRKIERLEILREQRNLQNGFYHVQGAKHVHTTMITWNVMIAMVVIAWKELSNTSNRKSDLSEPAL